MDLAQMVVKAGDYAFRRGSSATPDAPMTVAEQQRRRGLNKRVMRAVMLGMGVLTLAIMARTLQHSPAAAPGGAGRAAVAAAESSAAGRTPEHVDYAPGANLEAEEIAVLGKARRNIDIAMYAFTDKEIAELLASKARQGVRVRVYRDAEQYAQEESRAYGHETTSAVLRAAGVDVRVKARGALMHLKSYAVDSSFIRTGSANWSRAGLEDQDNDVFYIQSPDAVTAFSADFEALWNRSDNLVLARP